MSFSKNRPDTIELLLSQGPSITVKLSDIDRVTNGSVIRGVFLKAEGDHAPLFFMVKNDYIDLLDVFAKHHKTTRQPQNPHDVEPDTLPQTVGMLCHDCERSALWWRMAGFPVPPSVPDNALGTTFLNVSFDLGTEE